jgi:hypothetical protein
MSIISTGTINNNSNNTQGVTNSRLLTNSTNFRESLVSRNLYDPDKEYTTTNLTTGSKIVDAINSIATIITPFKSFDLTNTVFGRIVDNPTPLTQIGLAMLGTQLAYNASSHLSQQALPIIKISNLFDGNPNTHLFTANSDYRITTKEDIGTFANFIDRLKFWYPKQDYPFNTKNKNSDYIKSTGTGQLDLLFKSINNNVYKPANYGDDSTYYTFADQINTQINSASAVLGSENKKYFDFNNNIFNPYISWELSLTSGSIVDSIALANQNMINSTILVNGVNPNYAQNGFFVEEYFGTSKLTLSNSKQFNKDSQNTWIDDVTEFSEDIDNGSNSKLIWGRNGISPQTNNKSAQYRGDFNDANTAVTPDIDNTFLNFNPYKIKTGLLEYTRNLINATEGKIGDLTKKAFISNGILVGFNGSGLWKAPDTSLDDFKGHTGIRQHSVLDQYDRFAKAIRFNGNNVYGGNENSVIYNSVFPRIHPTLETVNNQTFVNNRNLMFSIENLAVGVFAVDPVDGYGVMDDEYGTAIPLSEVGPFNGRIMWFPPYSINIQETATAKFEPTVMVGRNEPLYSYQNSERSATITFTLLVDYPEQLKNFISSNKNKHREIAEFFAFGGDKYTTPALIKKKPDNKTATSPASEPSVSPPKDFRISFPNDEPNADQIDTIFDRMYNVMGYEIENYVIPKKTGDSSDGLNHEIYVISGLTKLVPQILDYTESASTVISQYNSGNIDDESDTKICELNKALSDLYSNEEVRDYWDVTVWGGSSKLFSSDYNIDLANRRAQATVKLIKSRLATIFDQATSNKITVKLDEEKTSTKSNGTVVIGSKGDSEASSSNATAAAITKKETKEERYAVVHFKRNSKAYTPKLATTNKDVVPVQDDPIQTNTTNVNTTIFNEKKITNKIFNGFEAISGNYYQQGFQSQTPEDFHKRLTFLHQCLRQGAAKRYSTVEENGQYKAKNSVFGRQPICILRIGDFFYTKIVIETLNIDYTDTTWDMNPEGFGMQPMFANVTLNIKVIGGQSLKGPIDALQNAVSYNYYANSTYSKDGIYALPSKVADAQETYINGVLATKVSALIDEDKKKNPNRYSNT